MEESTNKLNSDATPAAFPCSPVKTTRKWLYVLSRPKGNIMDTDKFKEPFTDKKGNTYWKRKNPLEIKGKLLTFGSDISCNVKINNNLVAPLHFKLIIVTVRSSDDGSMTPKANYKIMLENIQDTPVYINDVPVSKGTLEEVVSGDTLMIGKVKFLYEEHAAIGTPVKIDFKQKMQSPKKEEKEKIETKEVKKVVDEVKKSEVEDDYYDESIIPSCMERMPSYVMNQKLNKVGLGADNAKFFNKESVETDKKMEMSSVDKVEESKRDVVTTTTVENSSNIESKKDLKNSDDTKMVENYIESIISLDNNKEIKEIKDNKENSNNVEIKDNNNNNEIKDNKENNEEKKNENDYILGDIVEETDNKKDNNDDNSILNTDSQKSNTHNEDEDIEELKQESFSESESESVNKKSKKQKKDRINRKKVNTRKKDDDDDNESEDEMDKRDSDNAEEEEEEKEEEEEEEKITGRKRRCSPRLTSKKLSDECFEEPKLKKSKTSSRGKKVTSIFTNMTIVLTCIQSDKARLIKQIEENRGKPQSGFFSMPKSVPVTDKEDGTVGWFRDNSVKSKVVVVTDKDDDGLLPRSCTSLLALALHIPIVDKSWVLTSIKNGQQEDLGPYLLKVQGTGSETFSQPISFSTNGYKYGNLMIKDGEAITLMATSKDKSGSRISPDAHEVRELKTWEWIIETLGGRIVKPPKKHYDYELCIVFKEKCFHASQTYNLRVDTKLREKRRRRQKGKIPVAPPIVSAQWIANCLVQNELLPIESYTLDPDIFG